jgi:hypothetical protein
VVLDLIGQIFQAASPKLHPDTPPGRVNPDAHQSSVRSGEGCNGLHDLTPFVQ